MHPTPPPPPTSSTSMPISSSLPPATPLCSPSGTAPSTSPPSRPGWSVALPQIWQFCQSACIYGCHVRLPASPVGSLFQDACKLQLGTHVQVRSGLACERALEVAYKSAPSKSYACKLNPVHACLALHTWRLTVPCPTGAGLPVCESVREIRGQRVAQDAQRRARGPGHAGGSGGSSGNGAGLVP